MTMMNDTGAVGQIRQRIALAAAAALLGAGLILVTVVLPAEYGVDPLGTGARLGLVDLGLTGQRVAALEAAAAVAGAPGGAAGQPIIVSQERAFKQETIEFRLAPREGMEYKYRLDKGEALLYSWSATTPVNYELHAEPDGGPRGYAQSYEKRNATSQAAGTLTAPFSGIHGWFWENTSDQPITVTLTASGFFNLSHEFRNGAPVKNKQFQ